ncbi:BnaA10g05550D [Brassica napus]|uniref:BnaA10g05550D protein n=1 Tax=Brassica napus TaxID=3708 RepID=A0A078HJB0_BRANA|nr:BnaA10g05550D [Brassica napus]
MIGERDNQVVDTISLNSPDFSESLRLRSLNR